MSLTSQLAEQVEIFAALCTFSQSIQHQGDRLSGSFHDIDLEGLSLTSEKIRADAIAKGITILPSVHDIQT